MGFRSLTKKDFRDMAEESKIEAKRFSKEQIEHGYNYWRKLRDGEGNMIERKTPKFYICGYAKHGKDLAAEFITKYTALKFESSSWFCCQLFIYDKLAPIYGYKTCKECYEDRVRHRAEWYEFIREFNKGDESALSRAIFKENDIYVGCRAWQEISYDVADFVLWIDASKRVVAEDTSSINLTIDDGDIIITNNYTDREFEKKIERFCKIL